MTRNKSNVAEFLSVLITQLSNDERRLGGSGQSFMAQGQSIISGLKPGGIREPQSLSYLISYEGQGESQLAGVRRRKGNSLSQ